jgi:hypothetical protein
MVVVVPDGAVVVVPGTVVVVEAFARAIEAPVMTSATRDATRAWPSHPRIPPHWGVTLVTRLLDTASPRNVDGLLPSTALRFERPERLPVPIRPGIFGELWRHAIDSLASTLTSKMEVKSLGRRVRAVGGPV